MANACKKGSSECYSTKLSKKCTKPNPWVVFLRTHKGKFASKEDMLASYRADFLAKMTRRLSRVEDKSWTKKQKREEFQKILCAYFRKHQKKAGKDTKKNREGISRAVNKVLQKSSSTRESLSVIKKIRPPSKKTDRPRVARALQRLKEDLLNTSEKKKVRFGGVVGDRGGRVRVQRKLYDPSTKRKMNPGRSTVEQRRSAAVRNLRGDAEYGQRRQQCEVAKFMKSVADPSKNKKGKFSKTKGLLVAHGMGSGKTVTSLWVAKQYLEDGRVNFVNIVAPNVSVPEFRDSFEKAGVTPDQAGRIRVLTHDEFADNKRLRNFGNSLVVVDEAHLFTEGRYRALLRYDVPYLMLLSGTPAPNTPDDIVPLINLLCRHKADEMTKKVWNNKATTTKQKIAFMKDKVSVFNIGAKFNYMGKIGGDRVRAKRKLPGFLVKNVRVKLSESQKTRYLALKRKTQRESPEEREKHPFFIRERKIVYNGGGAGQAAATPKISTVASDIAKEMKKSDATASERRLLHGRLLVYVENHDTREALVKEIKRIVGTKEMKNRSIEEYSGRTSGATRARIKKSFNEGKTDVLIISSAGSVGLDLQCTSKVFVLDMSWNIPQMNQIIGRAIRFNSHSKKKTGCKHRHVDVHVYTSVLPKPRNGVKVFDQIVLENSLKKWKVVADMVESVMMKASIKGRSVCQSLK